MFYAAPSDVDSTKECCISVIYGNFIVKVFFTRLALTLCSMRSSQELSLPRCQSTSVEGMQRGEE